MTKHLTTISIALLLISMAHGIALAGTYVVTYRSLELVYIDGGRDDGLAVGDRGEVRRGNQVIAELNVAHIAAHSASCEILTQLSDIAVGDSVSVVVSTPQAETGDSASDSTPSLFDSPRWDSSTPTSEAVEPVVDGSVGLRLSHWNDRSLANLDFTQTNTTVRLQVSNLWDGKLAVAFRTRGRHNQRQRSYSDKAPESDWDHNIYEVSVVYGADDDPFHLHLGRISSRRVSGIGRFDGILVEETLSRISVGAFAGVEPNWQYHARDNDLRKLGGYAHYSAGSRRNRSIAFTLAAIAEYHASTVSREFLYTQGRFSLGNRFNVSHTAEFDVNRSWRRASAGEAVSLSNLYLYARYQVSNAIAASVNFDNRKNHWTYDMRDMADSLFDDNLRQGLRGRLDVDLPLRVTAQVGAGIRDRGGNLKPTHTYTASLRQSGGIWRGLSLRAGMSSFSGQEENGHNTSLNITQTLPHQVSVGIGYATYHYTLGAENLVRDNRRTDITARFPVKRRLRFDSAFQFNSGDDTQGHRFDAGLSYQF